jgi:hypothetical protein
MTKAARFTRADIERAACGAKAAGFSHVRIAIDPAGYMVIDMANESAPIVPERRNPLDRLLEGQ